MRMTRTHKVVIAAVATTIATASLLTFTRAEPVTPDQIAAIPGASNDSPTVAGSTPTAKAKKAEKSKADAKQKASEPDSPAATTPSSSTSGVATKPSKPSTAPTNRPTTPATTTPPPEPEPEPEPEPSPTPPRKKNLLEILLGM